MELSQLRAALASKASQKKAKILARFFKTGPGEYGEGDRFIGVVVPQIRSIVKQYAHSLSLEQAEELLHSPIHEERLTALLIFVEQFSKGDRKHQEIIFKKYLSNAKYINNWDLVDLSAPKIVGPYLQDSDRKVLYTLARSPLIWERRIAILATLHFIRNRDFTDALLLADLLKEDDHDLMHKAVGWMLREVGKRNQVMLESFLKTRYKALPRTLLRYAIERFDEPKRKAYLAGAI